MVGLAWPFAGFARGRFQVRDAVRVVRRVGHDRLGVLAVAVVALEAAATDIQCSNVVLVIGVLPTCTTALLGMPPPHAVRPSDGKENGAERRDEAKSLGHDAGTLAETP